MDQMGALRRICGPFVDWNNEREVHEICRVAKTSVAGAGSVRTGSGESKVANRLDAFTGNVEAVGARIDRGRPP